MNIKCDKCGQGNKGRYRSFDLQVSENKTKWVTWCVDCLDGKASSTDLDRKRYEEFSIPFWRHMGQKAKPKDLKFERYLKSRGMSYGEYRLEQNYLHAKQESAAKDFQSHVNKYGRKNAPDQHFGKKQIKN